MTTRTQRQLKVLYPSAVARCVRRLMVFPPPVRGPQRVLELQWKCTPEPDEATEYSDEFGNQILELHHRQIEREFRFEMTLVTARDDTPIPAALNLPETGRGAFLLPSKLCERSDVVLRHVEELKQQNRTSLPDLCEFVYRHLEYSENKTDTFTSGTQAVARGGGVCQDYTHLFIALCRTFGRPARYIAGYNPTEGRMHAWAEVLVSEQWQAWDPTHNRRTRPDCVFVACGRDFRDVAPHSGQYRGATGAHLESWCKTETLAGG